MNGLHLLRESKRKSDVLRSLSDLHLLWGKVNQRNTETQDRSGSKNSPVPKGTCRLGCVGTPRCGNKETCFYARNATGAGK